MPEDPYRRIAGIYDRIFGPVNRGLRLIGLRMFLPRREAAILYVGCETRVHLALCQLYVGKLAGVDTSPAMLRQARRRLAPDADLRQADASALPFGDREFDLLCPSSPFTRWTLRFAWPLWRRSSGPRAQTGKSFQAIPILADRDARTHFEEIEWTERVLSKVAVLEAGEWTLPPDQEASDRARWEDFTCPGAYKDP